MDELAVAHVHTHMGGGQGAAGAVKAAVKEEDQVAGLHGVEGHEVAAIIVLAGGAPGDGVAQLLVNVVHQAGAVEGIGAGPAGHIPLAQQALGHSGGRSAQLAGTRVIGAHQNYVLSGHVAGLDLIPAVAGIGHDVHHGAGLQGSHFIICSSGTGADIEHAGGDEAPLLLRLGALRGGDDCAVLQGDGEPSAGHIAGLASVGHLIPAVPGVLLHGDLGALGGLGDGGGAGAGLAAQAQAVGGDSGGSDRSERHAGTHRQGKTGGGQRPERLKFEIHWKLPPFFFRKGFLTCRPVPASARRSPGRWRKRGRADRSFSPHDPDFSDPDR